MSEEKHTLKDDIDFRELLFSERAQLLARVDAIEKFLGIDRTKDIRKLWKDATLENYSGIVENK